MRKISFSGIDLQLNAIKEELKPSVFKTIVSGNYILGPEVEKLETKLSIFCKSKFSITCANGTDAITLALMALDFKPNDFIVTPSFGFVSTVESPTQLGVKPIFIDINYNNFSINVEELKNVIVKAKKIILVLKE